MVDMDEVLTEKNFSRLIEEYLGYIPDYDSLKGYYLQDLLKDKKEDFFKYFKDINMYKYAKLLPDCYDTLKELSKIYEIYICTDYIFREIIEYAGNNLKNKYEFLYKELDFIKPQNYIFTADKSIINCDIKIDDKLENIKGAKTKLLFTAYHNKNIDDKELDKEGIVRVNNWKEIGNILINNKKVTSNNDILNLHIYKKTKKK